MAMFSNYSLINSTIFSAYQHYAKNRSLSDLQAEEQNDLKGIASNSSTNANININISSDSGSQKTSLSYNSSVTTNTTSTARADDLNLIKTSDSTETKAGYTKIMFNDPLSNTRITLNLSNENLEKLKSKFGKDDFYERSDGVVRLNGKAESFVSGWFGDIAYRQNYIGADKDGSGRVEDSERGKLKNGFLADFVVNGSNATMTSLEGYAAGPAEDVPLLRNAGLDYFEPSTIEEALNVFIEKDTNFDGKMELNEFVTKEDLIKEVNAYEEAWKNGTNMHLREDFNVGAEGLSPQELLLKMLQEEAKRRLKEQEILKKLKEANGNLGVLSKEEFEAISQSKILENKNGTDTLSTKELDSLQKEFDDKALNTLSKAYSIDKESLQAKLKENANKSNIASLSEQDKQLISVIDELRNTIKGGEIKAFETTA